MGALISMHQMNLSSYVVQEKMHRDGVSGAAPFLASNGGFAALSSGTDQPVSL
jgi:hypothetical protein